VLIPSTSFLPSALICDICGKKRSLAVFLNAPTRRRRGSAGHFEFFVPSRAFSWLSLLELCVVRSLSEVAVAAAPRRFQKKEMKGPQGLTNRAAMRGGGELLRRRSCFSHAVIVPFRVVLGHQNFLRRPADVGFPSHRRARHSATPRGHFIRNRTSVHSSFNNNFRPLARFDWKWLERRQF
jgi:hypothetical protein